MLTDGDKPRGGEEGKDRAICERRKEEKFKKDTEATKESKY